MLTLDINGTYLVLDCKVAVRVILKSPACFFDRIASDSGINISLPVNDVNRAILGNIEIFEKYSSSSDRKFKNATLAFGGAVLISGTLNVESAVDSYDCWLQSELGAMGEALQKKNMQDMAWPVTQTFVAKETYTDATDNYCAPIIRNPGFWDGKGREAEVEINYTDENGAPATKTEMRSVLSNDHYKNFGWLVNTELTTPQSGCVITPMLYLRYVIKESLRLNGWYINRNDMINANPLLYNGSIFAQLAIYNNIGIAEPTLTTESQPVVNWDYENNEMVEKDENIIVQQSW